jgi:hypothetical protein
MSKEICMDDYWNYIATPFFFVILLFGMFVLFNVSKTQFSGPFPIGDIIKGLRKQPLYPAAAAVVAKVNAKASNSNSAAAPAAAATPEAPSK